MLRVTNPHPYWKVLKTEHEVTIVNYLFKNQTIIKVPEIIAYSYNENTSPLKCEFILMKKVKGIILSKFIEENKTEK